jgi:hypothetical protein
VIFQSTNQYNLWAWDGFAGCVGWGEIFTRSRFKRDILPYLSINFSSRSRMAVIRILAPRPSIWGLGSRSIFDLLGRF